MTESNPFAQAAAQAGQQAATSAPQTNPLPFNTDSPFAKPSDMKGGIFVPTPPMEALQGRTCVFIPRTFNPNAQDPFNPGQTRKQWEADLYVLDGGVLRFWYKQKGNPNATPPIPEGLVEHVTEELTPERPYIVPKMWVSQAAIVPKLTGASEARQFLVCTIERGAQRAQREKGATDASVRAEHQAWIDRGKQGPEPKSLWLAADLNAEQMQTVMKWWSVAKDSIQL